MEGVGRVVEPKFWQKSMSFNSVYKDKTVLVTGHTGFKGSWLCVWLINLGANVVGYSIGIPTEPSNFEILNLKNKMTNITGDVRDIEHLNKVFDEYSPDMVFHLAAQAITRDAYDSPQQTFFTNLGGTVNVLECIRHSKSVEVGVIITSDKCYQNVEWLWGYRENDRLGGDDPYSASKACAEIAFHAYMKSFFFKENSPRMATVRAGNVIGGGDWSPHRILPDCVRAFSMGESLEIRNPQATRPWQYVLEPLSGYLWLGAKLSQSSFLHGESFNFGPNGNTTYTVKELVETFINYWGEGCWRNNEEAEVKRENMLLMLSCEKARNLLKWNTILSFEESLQMTAEWYKAFYDGGVDMYSFSLSQIEFYTTLACKRGMRWAKQADTLLTQIKP